MPDSSNDEPHRPSQSADDTVASEGVSAREADAFEQLEAQVRADPGAAGFPNLAEAFRRAGQPQAAREVAARGLESAPERLGGRVAHALALLDLSEVSKATQELMGILENIPEVPTGRFEAAEPDPIPASDADTDDEAEHPMWATPLAAPSAASGTMEPNEVANDFASSEIDDAFAVAETDPDGMLDAFEETDGSFLESEAEDAFEPGAHPTFATETMAGLLERQGDFAAAEEIRDEIEEDAEPVAEAWPAMPEPLSQAEEAQHIETVSSFAIDAAQAEVSHPEEPDESRERVVATLEGWLENIRRSVA